MSPKVEEARDRLAAELRERFRGMGLTTSAGPRAEGSFSEGDVRRAVSEWMAGQELTGPTRMRTALTARDARAAGQDVPAEVPDNAQLECSGIDAALDPADPTRISMWPKDPAWVWAELTFSAP